MEERNEQICKKYLEGRTLESVGQDYGLTRERVRQIIKSSHITERWTHQNKIKANRNDAVKKAMTLYLEGHSLANAAKMVGLSCAIVIADTARPTKLQRQIHRIAAFWRSVEKQENNHPILGTPCWLWTKGINEITGFGRYRFNGRPDAAHRVAYLLTKGNPVKWVLHRCDVRLCVNPDHLYDGTAKDNARDRDRSRTRNRRTSPLNREKAKEVRQRLLNGETCADIADELGMCATTIYNIKLNKTWKDKTGEKQNGNNN